ncbi:Mitochondrial inner membrane protease subunit 1 [Glycine soja]
MRPIVYYLRTRDFAVTTHGVVSTILVTVPWQLLLLNYRFAGFWLRCFLVLLELRRGLEETFQNAWDSLCARALVFFSTKDNSIWDLYLQRKTSVMILRNLEALEPIIKAGWRISKFFCFIHVTQTYLIVPAVIYGPSMLPTIDLKIGVFLMEKISPRFGKVACGDIVVLRNPQDPRRFMTKRVVGLEGDSITYISNPETYELEGDSFTHISSPGSSDKSKTIVVPKGAVWVEGDNKYNSNDSRKFGPVPYDLIDGKIFWRITPLKKFGPFWNK